MASLTLTTNLNFNKNKKCFDWVSQQLIFFKSLTKTMNNNIIFIQDAIKRYYTSGFFELQLKKHDSKIL